MLIAWNASRESTRAVNDALPLLAGATMVTVLAVNPRHGIKGHGDVPAADIALHLARHGVKAEAAHTVAKDISEGDALLSYAADLGVDLIVCGGYGHSRAREMVFGGVTRTLLREMTVRCCCRIDRPTRGSGPDRPGLGLACHLERHDIRAAMS